jgi:hypothetical protein
MTPQDAQSGAESTSRAVVGLPRTVFLANDVMFSQGLAFLESFRAYNPDLTLSMIPFADDIAKFERISSIYHFDILQLDTQRWDELAKEFFPNAQQKYRNRLGKLAIFDVKSPTTIYLDLDIVVLKDLTFLATKIIDGTADMIFAATNNDPWVYNETYRAHAQFANSRRFSDGFFAFNPTKFDGDRAFRVVAENKDLYLEVRAAGVYCQPVTNFIVDMMGLKTREVYSLFPKISPQVWYGGRLTEQDGQAIAHDGREVLFVHWAGPVDFASDFAMKNLFERYRSAGLRRIATLGIEE